MMVVVYFIYRNVKYMEFYTVVNSVWNFFLNNFLIVVVEIGKDSNFHEKAKSSFIWVPKMSECSPSLVQPAVRKMNTWCQGRNA